MFLGMMDINVIADITAKWHSLFLVSRHSQLTDPE